MKPSTEKYLTEFGDLRWFQCVGLPFDENVSFVSVHSWAEAVRASRTSEWDDILQDRHNDLRRDIFDRAHITSEQWNPLVREIRPVAHAVVDRQLSIVPAKREQTTALGNSLRWILVHAAIEVEFESVISSEFFRTAARIIQHGHCPCGWRNEGGGKFVVY